MGSIQHRRLTRVTLPTGPIGGRLPTTTPRDRAEAQFGRLSIVATEAPAAL